MKALNVQMMLFNVRLFESTESKKKIHADTCTPARINVIGKEMESSMKATRRRYAHTLDFIENY